MSLYIKLREKDNETINKISDINENQAILILAKCRNPIIDINLNEFGEDKLGFIQVFWKRLHPEGSHHGLSDIEGTLYRYQLVLLNIELLLDRFDKRYFANIY